MQNQTPIFSQWLLIFGTTIVPLLIFLGLMIFLSRQMQGSGNRALSFGKSRAKLHSENEPKITFEDVAGVDEAKEALEEVIEFLRAPNKFKRLGGTISKRCFIGWSSRDRQKQCLHKQLLVKRRSHFLV